VAKILGAEIVEVIHNHHNFAWHEKHGDEMYWVVRKGATPAFPGEKGFVGGSMGEQSVILEGVENENAKYSLYSTVHGAGRAMGRKEATGVYDRKTGACKRVGKVTQEMMRAWVDRSGIALRGGGLDESPDCYKRLDEVLTSVSDSVRILHRLTPVGVAMAPAREFDPYKD
jgi:tRNA-splicing ligase RtcB